MNAPTRFAFGRSAASSDRGTAKRAEAGRAVPRQADECIASLKGCESGAAAFFPVNQPFFRTAPRVHHRHLGPLQADAVMVGEGDAPVVAVLVSAVNSSSLGAH
jgi:hypothetical protein